jgi:UDP-perosamine 4-acetyltransferase
MKAPNKKPSGPKRRKLLLLGAGGHAKVVLDALFSSGSKPVACLDPDPKLKGDTFSGVPIQGGEELIGAFPSSKYDLINGVGAPRDNQRRKEVFERFRSQGYEFPPVVASSALCSASSSLGAGAQILTRAVVHPGAVIGENTIVNTGAIVEHDCAVGAHAHVAPGAILCGGVRVEEEAFNGSGAVVLPGLRVGRKALVAAGTVLRKDLPAGGRALPAGTR